MTELFSALVLAMEGKILYFGDIGDAAKALPGILNATGLGHAVKTKTQQNGSSKSPAQLLAQKALETGHLPMEDFGIFLVYLVFNVAAAVGLYWLAKVPKGKREKRE